MRAELAKAAILICTSFLVACVSGCGANSDNNKKPGGSTSPVVAFVTNNPAEFWTICEAGAQAAAKEEGVNLVFKRPQDSSAAGQKAIIEDLLAKGIQAISVSVISPENQTAFLNTVAKKIPLLCVDNDAAASDTPKTPKPLNQL